jgi:uncharacterized protein YegL
MIKCCVEKCSSTLDIVIVMDSSGSIGAANFLIQKNFVKNLLAGLNLGRNDTRVGLINYNTRVDILLNLANFTDYNTTAKIIDDIVYTGGFTYTGLALKAANEQVLQESLGMRPILSGIPKVVIVITDGESTDPGSTLFEADRIKRREFSIISVGIGNAINLNELVAIASSPNDQYLVEDFDKLSIILAGYYFNLF